jgi:adenine/guanine phosphoribosyltransferase-like PRPP-binding protein
VSSSSIRTMGLIVSGNELSQDDGILIVGTALCGGSMYFSMYTLIEDMGANVLGFAFLIEKVWHRGRYKLMDNTLLRTALRRHLA